MFYYIKNLSSQAAYEIEKPWDLPDLSSTVPQDKAAWSNWAHQAKTDHKFLSAYEGITALVRVSASADVGNAPLRLHGLLIDYDAKQDAAECARRAAEDPAREYRPAYFYQTLRYVRGVWLFEEPVNLPPGRKAQIKFLEAVNRNVQFRKWAAGWEDETYYVPNKYYAAHGKWIPACPDYRIPKNELYLWLFEGVKKLRLDGGKGASQIPLEKIKEEIDLRWPGAWTGPFQPGIRCNRFWDPTALNPTAAVLHPDGFVCYSGDKNFVSWRDLLGQGFVDKFMASRIAPILELSVHDTKGDRFWTKEPNGAWLSRGRDDYRQFLRVKGFESRADKEKTYTEVDEVMQAVVSHRSVDGAQPFIFMPDGVTQFQGNQLLNTSTRKVMAPAPPGIVFTLEDMKEQCPFLWKFLSTFFEDAPGQDGAQLQYFLCWLKHFYEGGYKQNPTVGQAIVMVGGEGAGKSFLLDVIMDGLMGGTYDAGHHIVRGEPWTNYISFPIAKIDDAVASSNLDRLAHFQAQVKSLVANTLRTANTKYGSVCSVLWHGRVMIALNPDPTSMQLLPTLEISARTKISYLKVVSQPKVKFDENRDHNRTVVFRELPFLARYLLEMRIPDELKNPIDTRYLLKPFHHPELLVESVQTGTSHMFLELLHEWAKSHRSQRPEEAVWTGTASNLFRQMLVTEALQGMLTHYTPSKVGVEVNKLRSRGLGIKKLPMINGFTRYEIPLDLFEKLDARQYVGEGSYVGKNVLSTVRDQASFASCGAGEGEPEGVPGALLAGDGAHGGGGGRTDGGPAGSDGDHPGEAEDLGAEAGVPSGPDGAGTECRGSGAPDAGEVDSSLPPLIQ